MLFKHLLFSILLFLFIYSFPIISIVNSSHIAGVISILSLLIVKKHFFYFKLILKNKITMCIFLFYIAMLIYSTLNTTLQGEYDYSMQKTIINNIFSYIICLFIISLFFAIFPSDSKIEKDLSIILILQSIIIVTMLISSDFRLLIQGLIRTESEIKRMAVYDGVRGLGLADSIAFGLAITMGLLSFVFIDWFSTSSKLPSIIKALIFLLILIACLSAGRTSILSFIMGGIYFFIKSKKIFLIKKTIKYSLILTLSIILLICYSNNDNSLSYTINRYVGYAFQPIINYFDHGSFSVSSIESLNNMYFMPDNEFTIFFGDGKYSAEDGTYYMNTDSGYLRFMLYFGLLGSLIPYIAFLTFCLYSSIISKKLDPSLQCFFWLIILMSFIFHYKAEVIFYNVAYMKIIYLLGFSYIIKESINRDLRVR